jgi:hypothetical protein
LVEQYVQRMIEQSRAERAAGSKKKNPLPPSSWRRTKKSSN